MENRMWATCFYTDSASEYREETFKTKSKQNCQLNIFYDWNEIHKAAGSLYFNTLEYSTREYSNTQSMFEYSYALRFLWSPGEI